MSNKEEQSDVEARIIEAAKRVFINKGYEAAKMGDIAAEAGIGRTSLNYYFRTKEMLFAAIFGQLMDALLPNIAILVDEEGHYTEKLRKLIHLYLTTLSKNPLFPLFVVNELHRDPEHLFNTIMKEPSRVQPMLKLQRLVLSEMEKGTIRRVPLIDLVANLISLVIFPFLIRTPLSVVFTEDKNSSNVEEFFNRREEVVYNLILDFLDPNNNNTKK
jgi:Transcriptional regulator